jgi:hypothetical protein
MEQVFMKTTSYLRVVRASAWYDLVTALGFVTPWTFVAFLAGMDALSGLLGMQQRVPEFEPAHMLMVNLMGSLILLWAILRLRDTRVAYGRYDAAARLLYATWQLYALAHGAHPLIWAFVVFEILFGVAEALPVRSPDAKSADGAGRSRHSRPGQPAKSPPT